MIGYRPTYKCILLRFTPDVGIHSNVHPRQADTLNVKITYHPTRMCVHLEWTRDPRRYCVTHVGLLKYGIHSHTMRKDWKYFCLLGLRIGKKIRIDTL